VVSPKPNKLRIFWSQREFATQIFVAGTAFYISRFKFVSRFSIGLLDFDFTFLPHKNDSLRLYGDMNVGVGFHVEEDVRRGIDEGSFALTATEGGCWNQRMRHLDYFLETF
jgi:hypothetical protein